MKGSLRKSMAWLHTWTGLLLGWILFAMFMTGTASYFRPEITRYMEPETGRPASVEQAAVGAVAHLQKVAPAARSWNIQLPDEREAVSKVSWKQQLKPGEKEKRRRGVRNPDQATLDAATGQVVTPRDTRGGEFFYRLHFQLHYMPVLFGRWVVGLCAMSMLVAIVSGVITHKRIFKDFFTFRPGKAAQRSWLDAHNLTAVLALPFHAMITYTGLVTLMSMYMPWGIAANYEKPATYFEVLFPQAKDIERSGIAAPMIPIKQVLAKASDAWDGGRPASITILQPGDAAQRIQVTRHGGDQLAYNGGSLTFDGTTGDLVSASPKKGPAVVTGFAMYGLHMGRFAGPVLRWVYFFCGLSGCAMVATGLVLWTVKRREKLPDPERPHFGFRLVERLNIGAIAGVPAGMAAMLWCNRLLPVEMANRSPWEVHSFFIAWAAMIVWACCRPTRRAWVENLSTAAFLVAALPLLSAVTTPRNLVSNMLDGNWAMVAFDLALFGLGALLAVCAVKAGAYRPAPKKKGRAQQVAEAAA